ncbi:MAG TPA: TonB family protein [Kofleriaceae bacterium]
MLRVVAVLCALCAIARAQDARPPDKAPAPKLTNVVTKAPKLIQAQAPEYPPAALAAGKQAKVKVRIHIDENGVVSSVDVLEKVGDGFDEAAVAAASQYVFEPAEIDGKPGAIAVETTINFTIEQQPVEEPPPLPPPPSQHDGPPNHAGSMKTPVTLQGEVVERGTRKQLAGVIVSIAELGLDAVTANDGTFFFHGVPPGKYTVLAVDEHYDRFKRPIEISNKEALQVRLWMRPRGGNPYETVIEGERDNMEVTKRSLQRQQLTNIPGTFGDPIRVIQTLPGLQRAPFGLGLLLVRGSNPDDTGIFIDGHEVPGLFHFLGGPSIFNAEMLESLDLYPGGFPGRFGRHHGGVVALESRDTKSDGVHGSAKVDFLDAGGYIRAPITDDLTVAFAGRRSYIDVFLGFVLPAPAKGAQRVVTPVYYDYQARADYNLHEDGHASLFVIGSSDALHVLNQDPDAAVSQDLNSSVKFLRVIGSYERPLSGDLKLTMSPAWGRDEVSFSGGQAMAAGPFSSVGVINDDFSYRMRVKGKLAQRLTLDTGIDMLSRVTTYQALIPVDDSLINSSGVDITPTQIFRGSQLFGAGAYIDLGIDLTDRLKIVPTLRADEYILDGVFRESIDPRIVARYKLSDQWTLKGYVGRFTQPPQPEALDRRFGNPNVQLEHGMHYGLGYEWRPDHVWSIDSEVYYVERHNLVIFSNDVTQSADGSYSYVNFTNEGRNYSYGVEAIIKREITEHLYGWLSYTYSRAREKRHADSDWVPTTFDQPHVLNAVASYKPGGGFEFGARFQLASGRPDTPVIGATYDADTGGYVAVRGDARSVRDPNFYQLDARVERDWLFERWSFGLYIDVINVLNTTNVEAYQYDYRFRQRSPITSFPILPTLGVKGTW